MSPRLLLAALAALFAAPLAAQPPPPNAPAPVPVDGGLALLAVAGGAYAVKRLRREP